MTEELKELIEKIQQEGIQAAEDKARAIEDQARRQAQEIIEKAKAQAQQLIADTQAKVAKAQENGRIALEQTGRDLLLSLKKEINAILNKVILSSVREALSPQELVKIITLLIRDYSQSEKGDVIISLNKKDIEKIEKDFFCRLEKEIKKGITLRPSEDILGGFVISYDGGKSSFDFTDKAIAEYIALYLKPKLGEILKDALSTTDTKT